MTTITAATPAPSAADIALLERLLQTLLDRRASDLHLEPGPRGHRARLRIEGELVPVPGGEAIGAGVLALLCSRAGLPTTTVSLPLLGAVETEVAGRAVRLRASFLPTLAGLLVSLHRPADRPAPLGSLGLTPPGLVLLQDSLCLAGKLVLLCGPAGAGKTTTLHAALAWASGTERLVVSAEHPVEARVPGVHQLELHPERGLDLDTVLPPLLAHGPALVGLDEVRDWRAARAAVRIALAGSSAVATIAAPDATAALSRLLDLGVEPFLLTTTVRAVAAQRLLSRLCPDCRKPATLDAELLSRLEAAPGQQAFAAAGCDTCAGTGRRGKLAVFELLELTPALQELFLCGASAAEMRAEAVKFGLRSLRQGALALLASGEVDAGEVLAGTPADRSLLPAAADGAPQRLLGLDPVSLQRAEEQRARARAPREDGDEP